MKTMKLNYSRSILSFAITLFVGVVFQSCATKHVFSTSSVVPAAQGSVKIKKDNNKNYTIDLNTIRLADSKRLNPSKEMYVVWMDTESNGTKNLGQLNTSSSLLSKTMKSSLKTVTPFNPVRIFITAEDNADYQYPGGQIVLDTGKFN